MNPLYTNALRSSAYNIPSQRPALNPNANVGKPAVAPVQTSDNSNFSEEAAESAAQELAEKASRENVQIPRKGTFLDIKV